MLRISLSHIIQLLQEYLQLKNILQNLVLVKQGQVYSTVSIMKLQISDESRNQKWSLNYFEYYQFQWLQTQIQNQFLIKCENFNLYFIFQKEDKVKIDSEQKYKSFIQSINIRNLNEQQLNINCYIQQKSKQQLLQQQQKQILQVKQLQIQNIKQEQQKEIQQKIQWQNDWLNDAYKNGKLQSQNQTEKIIIFTQIQQNTQKRQEKNLQLESPQTPQPKLNQAKGDNKKISQKLKQESKVNKIQRFQSQNQKKDQKFGQQNSLLNANQSTIYYRSEHSQDEANNTFLNQFQNHEFSQYFNIFNQNQKQQECIFSAEAFNAMRIQAKQFIKQFLSLNQKIEKQYQYKLTDQYQYQQTDEGIAFLSDIQVKLSIQPQKSVIQIGSKHYQIKSLQQQDKKNKKQNKKEESKKNKKGDKEDKKRDKEYQKDKQDKYDKQDKEDKDDKEDKEDKEDKDDKQDKEDKEDKDDKEDKQNQEKGIQELFKKLQYYEKEYTLMQENWNQKFNDRLQLFRNNERYYQEKPKKQNNSNQSTRGECSSSINEKENSKFTQCQKQTQTSKILGQFIKEENYIVEVEQKPQQSDLIDYNREQINFSFQEESQNQLNQNSAQK